MHNKIKLCSFVEYSTGRDFLLQTFNLTKSQIKKYKISKSFLNEKLFAKKELELPINLVNHGKINPIYRGEIIHEQHCIDTISTGNMVWSNSSDCTTG